MLTGIKVIKMKVSLGIIMLVSLLLTANTTLAKGGVARSSQGQLPDGFLVVSMEGYIKIDKGVFKYCLGGQHKVFSKVSCESYGSATDYIKEQTGNQGAVYVGMGADIWQSDQVILFYTVIKVGQL
jgi:hypothetical protein